MVQVAVFAAVYTGYGLVRFTTGRTNSWDLVIFDQAVRSYSTFHGPISPIKGIRAGYGMDFNLLADHFSPILAALAPLYWLHDGPRTLIVAQAVLFAVSAVPLWFIAERTLGRRAAGFVVFAYLLSRPLWEALAVDFHETAFAPLLFLCMAERWQAGRRWQALAVGSLLLLVKEDAGLLLVGFGLFLLTQRGQRRPAALFILVGLAGTLAAARLVIPFFGGDPSYYWAYGDFGPDPLSAAAHAVTHPQDVVTALFTPSEKPTTVVLLLAPLLFLPLRSPQVLVVVPLLLERMLADSWPNWWSIQFHYNAFLVAPLFVAAIDGAARLTAHPAPSRLAPTLNTATRWWPPAIALTAVALLPFTPIDALANPAFYRTTEHAAAAKEAARQIPSGATVDAHGSVGPFLTHRTRVLLWDNTPHPAPWLIVDTTRPPTPVIPPTCHLTWHRHGYEVHHCP
ncbi:DUF2079 domain-containing protein [Actinocorallia sp. API 0066]|uniref:DUF2079 domain-containing protein n=1 Tax=Actinocorallia sp. API 0066 TaxID=2896846 RepID=UPI0027DEFE87|nr:DUF2079 domain-containing protein [Actinocorallia sp. API 0066]